MDIILLAIPLVVGYSFFIWGVYLLYRDRKQWTERLGKAIDNAKQS